MGSMRSLLPAASAPLDDDALADLYATGPQPLLRLNMVSTLDGSAVGPDAVTGSINTPPDNRVFSLLRAWADVILVGHGTVRAEGYAAPTVDPRWAGMRRGRDAHPAMVVLTSTGALPPAFDDSEGGECWAVTATSVGDLSRVLDDLRSRGLPRVLCEGGPTVAGELLEAGLVDELCLSWTPHVVVGDAFRIAHGHQIDSHARLLSLLEEDSTLIGRWGLRSGA